MGEITVRARDFRGLASDIPPGNLPPEHAALDEGSSHFGRQSWALRRGMTRTAAAPADAAVTCVGGFETINSSFSFFIVDEDGNFTGYPTVAFGGGSYSTTSSTSLAALAPLLPRLLRVLRTSTGGGLRTALGGPVLRGGA
jgi:hypothetical protein